MTKTKISLIAAIASGNRALGRDNDLIYKIPEDLKRFREITGGHTVIMGRKTYESIGRPLPNRTNIVITRDPNYSAEGVSVIHSLDEALQLAEGDEVFIIGGGQIYQEAIKLADKLYLTLVEGSPEADTFFPDYSEFKKIVWQSEEQESSGFKYKFLELER
ncbi:MAG: dihydrofolate reductase [Candidatus Daviesbacteria bacterium]|nr:dihydrofolate reductase [Candidatus Daviesbacteria bacterium]